MQDEKRKKMDEILRKQGKLVKFVIYGDAIIFLILVSTGLFSFVKNQTKKVDYWLAVSGQK